MQLFLSFANFVFVIIGAVAILRMIFIKFISFPNTKYHFVVFLEDDNVEMSLREVIEKNNLIGTKRHKIFAVDNGLSQDSLRVCEIMAQNDSRIVLCKQDDLPEKLKIS